MNSIKLLVVEDDAMMQLGLKKIIQSSPDWELLDIVDNGKTAIEKAIELQPDVILMDLGLPEMDGIQATKEIKTRMPGIQVIAFTCSTSKPQVIAAFASGADGYCIKGIKLEQLKTVINTIREGSVFLDAGIAQYLIDLNLSHPLFSSPNSCPLNPKKEQILQLLARGKTNGEISDSLNMNPNTVKKHIQAIFNKLAVSNRVEAAVKAWHLGLVSV
jgi:DNA-binding NarL/FixJ family response regulator